jgi:hypothetical protein
MPSLFMEKLQLNLVRVFNSRSGRVHALQLHFSQTEQPNLKLKTRPKQLLGSLPLVIALPGLSCQVQHLLARPESIQVE